ncbi:MAG: 30S ribosomal protein S9 [Planctomycetota bacterium]|nr:30S ribosomal protein S9 [Planctomycetota bacterium]
MPETTIESTPATSVALRGPDRYGWYWGTGRRKAAIARVRVKSGKGEFTVNDRPFEEFCVDVRDRQMVGAVFESTSTKGQLEIRATTTGGGTTGQTGALILGLARALREFNPNLEGALREQGFLTRDARRVERKKYGQPGARRRFQFSKR